MTRATPSQERANITRRKIADAGLVIIKNIGRDRFTTNDVAREAGVSIGTFYRYFEDRVALLRFLYPNAVEGLGDPRDLDAPEQ